MKLISLAAASTLTEWSERTFWRRFSDGSVKRVIEHGKSMIELDSIKPYFALDMTDEELVLMMNADNGDAAAQTDTALVFLEKERPKSALYWLELAAKQEYPDAMHWLGRACLEGNGVPKDENMGMMWLAKAAAHGHFISQAQMQAIRDTVTRNR